MLKLCLGVTLYVFTLSCLVTADDQDGSASLLYCDDDIRNFSLTSGKDSLLMSGIQRPWRVDYHMKSKVFFWIDDNGYINKAPLWQELARPSVLRRSVDSRGLAVDWIHNLIYWTEYSKGAIGVSRLDGSMVRTVLKEEGIKPYAIELNPAEGFMFWSDDGVTKKIERCNMDGTNRKVIVQEDISNVYGLAIDLDSQRVFWVDGSKNYLSSAKFDGNHRRNLITQLKGPSSIDIYGQYVYFVTYASGHEAVYRASKVDGSGMSKLFDGKRTLYSIKVFHPSKQLEGNNVCGDNNGGCSHLCLPTSGHTFSCACPNDRNMSSDNFNCLNTDGSVVTTTRLTTSAPTSHLPFTVPQTNFPSTTDDNKNADATAGSSGTHLTLAVVIASVAFIAMIGMLIYNRHLLTRIVANAGNTNPVQKRNREENMYMEAPL